MISALEKISGHSQVGINNSQMASMFIENPLNKISYLFQTHPSVEDRVKALRNY
jgi:Zn-dependent protease with chaperone function